MLVLMPLLLWMAVWTGMFGEIATEHELQNIRNHQASEVYSADGQLLGKYYLFDRSSVTFDDLPPHLVDALIATEDARFFDHKGIDYRSLVRVFVKTILFQNESAGGGSTISQQLAKNLFPRQDFGLLTMPVNKVKEMVIATRLEHVYAKQDIIALYLNTVPFGDYTFGIESASRRFFNLKAKELTVVQGAVLIGMLKANFGFNPRVFPEQSLERRNVVLGQMHKYGYLSQTGLDTTVTKPIVLDYTPLGLHEGLAPYFREQIRQQLLAWCEAHTKPDGTPYNLYTDGLRVHTTIDAGMQDAAEQAMRRYMKDLQAAFEKEWGSRAPWLTDKDLVESGVRRTSTYMSLEKSGRTEEQIADSLGLERPMEFFDWDGTKEVVASTYDSVAHHLKLLQAGFVAIDPHSGHVKAWVGGIDHRFFQYDHVNINTKRQVGSTFKPLVFAAAIESGVEPCDYFSSARVTYANMEDWRPENANGDYDGRYNMKGALAQSVNTVSVKVLEAVGIQPVIKLAADLNISSQLPQVPSLALGSANISMIELAGAYAAFANGGIAVAPQMLLKVEDADGTLLEEFTSSNLKPAMSKKTAHLVVDMMQSVVNEGTAASLRWKYKLTNDLAGKTGTTQSNRDGWFVGMLPGLVTVTWIGANNPKVYFKSTKLGQGASSALPIFAYFLEKINSDPAYRHLTQKKFDLTAFEPSLYVCDPYEERRGFVKKIFSRKEQDVRDFGESNKRPGVLSAIKGLFRKKKNQE